MTRPLLACLLIVALTACTERPPDPPPDERLAPRWQALVLPMPPGQAGRLAVRDAVRCGPRWYVAGAVFPSPGASRPALWSSEDGESWTSEPLAPRGYWARRSVLFSVGCRAGQVALLGGRSGGAHGNPRVSSWVQRRDGVFADVLAPSTLYGGAEAVNVARIDGGASGWLIVGNRTSGPAVWTSADAAEFALLDDDPALSDDDLTRGLAIDQVRDGPGWAVVGSASLRGRLARVPMAWASTDGRSWRRQPVPRTEEFNDLERVIAHAGGLLAVGLRGEAFGVWRRGADGGWELGETFARLDPAGRGTSAVAGLTVVGRDEVLASVGDRTRYQLWVGTTEDDGPWRPVPTPTSPPVGGERRMVVVAAGDRVLLLTDDGERGRAWATRWPPAVTTE